LFAESCDRGQLALPRIATPATGAAAHAATAGAAAVVIFTALAAVVFTTLAAALPVHAPVFAALELAIGILIPPALTVPLRIFSISIVLSWCWTSVRSHERLLSEHVALLE
jgi:hypothetical protein